MTTTLSVAANTLNFAKGTVTATDETISLTRLITAGGVAIQLSGTWTGTVTFEATVDGTNWVSIGMLASTQTAAATLVVSSTANGAFSVQNNGYTAMRGRFSTASSGTVTIAIRGVQQRTG